MLRTCLCSCSGFRSCRSYTAAHKQVTRVTERSFQLPTEHLYSNRLLQSFLTLLSTLMLSTLLHVLTTQEGARRNACSIAFSIGFSIAAGNSAAGNSRSMHSRRP
jgi:hypothetical protein